MKVVSRKNWKARTAKSTSYNRLNSNSTLFVHYSAFDGGSYDTVEKQKQCMRNIQNYHMDNNRWSDIGYSYVVFQPTGRLKRARVYQARTFRNVPAAQAGYNTGNGAVCVVAGSNNKIRKGTIRKLKAIYKRFPGTKVKGHRDVNQTSCPGDDLYSKLGKIRKAKKKITPRLK